MRLSKDISIDQNKLILYYNDNNTDPKEINKVNVTKLVTIELEPQQSMTEQEGNNYINNHKVFILNEMMKVVSENEKFYTNFVVERRFNGEGAHLVHHFGRQLLIKMDKRLHINLKPKSN